MTTSPVTPTVRLCITRDVARAGWHGCVVLDAAPPVDRGPLDAAAASLERYHWLVCASQRAVDALCTARGAAAWPPHLRTAAVGAATAGALLRAGASEPLTGPDDGARSLWTALATAADWPGQRVLVLTTPGGLTTLADHLAAAGAEVEVVEAYRMQPRHADDIRRNWAAASPDVVVVTSPRSAVVLVDAIGLDALRRVRVVAAGETTAARLQPLGIRHEVAPTAEFARLAPWLEARLGAVVTS